jgi:hypothetical protein
MFLKWIIQILWYMFVCEIRIIYLEAIINAQALFIVHQNPSSIKVYIYST